MPGGDRPPTPSRDCPIGVAETQPHETDFGARQYIVFLVHTETQQPAPCSREKDNIRIFHLIALDSDAALNAAWARRAGMIYYIPRSARVARQCMEISRASHPGAPKAAARAPVEPGRALAIAAEPR